jgi:hypothetical protein
MKRIVLLVTVALVMALMMAVAGPASATIHPLVCSENSAAPSDTPAQTQNPPGITGGDEATEAQPVNSVSGNPTAADNAFKDEGC